MPVFTCKAFGILRRNAPERKHRVRTKSVQMFTVWKKKIVAVLDKLGE